MEHWVQFERLLRSLLPEKRGPAYYWKRDFLKLLTPEAEPTYTLVAQFRNEVVHGHREPGVKELEENVQRLKQPRGILRGLPNNRMESDKE